MADIAVTSRHADRFARHHASGKWSRQSSTFAIIGLSLLGWVIIGSALQQILTF